MAELDKKTLVRKGQRLIAQKRLTEVDEVLDGTAGGAEPNQVRLAQLELGIQEKLQSLRRLDEEILALTENEADVMREIEEADECIQQIYDKLVRIGAFVGNPSNASGPKISATHSTQAKLPKLNLPKFSGDLTEWTTFWDLCKVAVHGNEQLSGVEKFSYLQSLVLREAKETIAGLALTEANYGEAIALLEARFGNKERIISRHMEALLGLESVTWQGNITALRALHDKVETHLRVVKALGVSAEAYNSLLPSVIMRKLPSELRLSISRHVPEDNWKLDPIMTQLGMKG